MGLSQLSRRLLALSLVVLATTPVIGQNDLRMPTREERLSDPIYLSWIAYEPVTRCVSCHVTGPSEADIDSGRSGDLTSFSRQREMLYWLNRDKHTIARRRVEPFAREQSEQELNQLFDRLDKQIDNALEAYRDSGIRVNRDMVGLRSVPEEWIGESNILSRRICDKLWGPGSITTEEGYAKFRDACLTCHGGYQPGDTGFGLADLDEARLGIDCLYCHQKGENDQWVAPHQLPDKWRLLPPDQKEAAGLRDLVSTSKQADMCFDCHVGNRQKNMFVTHEMYAAGHPPIPSIEVQKFCEEMPQHWQTPSQLHDSLEGYEGREKYFDVNYPGVTESIGAGDVFWNTRKMLIGALTARKKAAQLYVDSATEAHPWADYSLYDCAACHHELKTDSRRQARGFPGAPGRPRQHEWPDALLGILYQQSSLASAVDLEQQLVSDFSRQPFGEPQTVGATAAMLGGGLDLVIEGMERKPVNVRVAQRLLLELTKTPVDRLMTYDSARQVVWAIQTIASELSREGRPLKSAPAELVRSLGQPDAAGINAKLPSGRKVFIFPDELRMDLELRANYDPQRLKAQLDQIRGALLARKGRSANSLVAKP